MQADILQQEISEIKDDHPSSNPRGAVSDPMNFASEPHSIPLARTFSHLSQMTQERASDKDNKEKIQSALSGSPRENKRDGATISVLSVQKVLPPSDRSASIQGEEEKTAVFTGNYQQLPEESPTDQLYAFLEPIGIIQNDIREAGISEIHLVRLFQQETSCFVGLKWSTLDHALEKLLQWPLLHPQEVGSLLESSYIDRIKPAERSILLKSQWGLIKAYGARGFAKGLELGLTQLVQYFISAMLVYRIITLIQTGEINFEEFKTVFQGSDEKGIDSLVVTLAQLNTSWLKFVLTTPLIIGCIQSLPSMVGSQAMTSARLEELQKKIADHLAKSGRVWRDVLWEGFPILSNFLSLTSQLQKLERSVRWDGRLTMGHRKQVFELVHQVAITGEKLTQLNAMECLAKIANGIGIKDFKRLRSAGYVQEELIAALYTKVTAYAALESLSQSIGEEKPWASRLRRAYASYLLGWLGQSSSFWKQQLPFVLFKIAKLGIGILFLQRIIVSILEAIRCPDRQGFELGFGYSQYADLLTIDCYLQMITQFRSVNLSDSVQQLVEQTQNFNLVSLNSLTLYYKNLTGHDMVAILQSAENRSARFTECYIFDYFTDADMQAFSTYLNTSNIEMLTLGAYDATYGGGEGLSAQGLQYLVQVLSFMDQLTYLDIEFPNVNDSGIESLADVLNTTHINRFYLTMALMSDKSGIKIAQALATMSIRRMIISGNQIGDGTIQALSGIIQNSSDLTELWIEGDFITNMGAQIFSQMIQYSSLDTVGLLSMNITDEGLTALVTPLLNLPLQDLGIGSLSGEAGIIDLINQLNKTNLWRFTFYYNSFTENSMKILADALPSTIITEIAFVQNNLNQELISQLAPGIADSIIDNLSIWSSNLSNSMPALGPSLSKIEVFSIENANLTESSLIALVPFLVDSKVQELDLNFNQISDQAILALAEMLPKTRINHLELQNNNITNIGATSLADIYPNSDLQTLLLTGNNISSDILYQVENFQWQVYCQDQLCHANAQYNGGVDFQAQPPSKESLASSALEFRVDLKDSDIDESNVPFIFGQGSSIEVMEENELAVENPWERVESEDLVSSEQPHELSALTKSTLPIQAAAWLGLHVLQLQSSALTDPSMMQPQATSCSLLSDNWMAIGILACGLLSLSAGIGIIIYKKSTTLRDVLHSHWQSAQQFSLWQRSYQPMTAPVVGESPSYLGQTAVSRF